VTKKPRKPAPFDGGFVWCRYDTNDPSICWPHVLGGELFDRLTGGTYTPGGYEESIMAARWYPTHDEAVADYEKAKVPT
jgi:hypothetical protein